MTALLRKEAGGSVTIKELLLAVQLVGKPRGNKQHDSLDSTRVRSVVTGLVRKVDRVSSPVGLNVEHVPVFKRSDNKDKMLPLFK